MGVGSRISSSFDGVDGNDVDDVTERNDEDPPASQFDPITSGGSSIVLIELNSPPPSNERSQVETYSRSSSDSNRLVVVDAIF